MQRFMDPKLKNRIVVVAGGTAGIGLAAAKLFVAEGAQVFITGRRQPDLDKAVGVIGANVTAIRGDISNLVDIDFIYQQIREKAGLIDVLFVNARFYEDAKCGEITEEDFDKTFNANVQGLFFVVQKALPMLSQGSSVILIGSIASVKGFESFSVFEGIKAAVRSFARTWTRDLRGRGIRVNVLAASNIDAPGLSALMTFERDAATVAKDGAYWIASRISTSATSDS